MDSTSGATDPKKETNVKREVWEWTKAILIAVIAALLIRQFLFTMIVVDGPSMQETLQDGDRLAVTILDMKLNGPARDDIVICYYPDYTTPCVKRVIGMPGETIRIEQGITYINEQPYEQNYIEHQSMVPFGPYTVPEGSYFVMGDNRSNSHDSRDADVSAIPKDKILGKVRMVVWPFQRFQTIG
ncbi:signal peptidase I [Eubacteriales bacterium OttesenSCG-928-N13]|nr:signal peptidase I [Eubacteriales bacterium OttesenSCG-928-N13]